MSAFDELGRPINGPYQKPRTRVKHSKKDGSVILEWDKLATAGHTPEDWWDLRASIEREFDTICRMTVDACDG